MKKKITSIAMAFFMIGTLLGCTGDPLCAERGDILTSDGKVLARSGASGDGFERIYPEKSLACQLVGSCYAEQGSSGIEYQFRDELENMSEISLTINSRLQHMAETLLDGRSGTVVVVNPQTGGVLALASTPACDLNDPDEEGLVNRAVELCIPGSIFKTITLAAALEEGELTLDSVYDAPASLVLPEGAVVNYNTMQYNALTVREAYVQSCNTVFAQISLQLGLDDIDEMAEKFGFDQMISQDIDCPISTIQNKDVMTGLARAWCGVGQALLVSDDCLVGPVTTALHMASIASYFANDGVLYAPYTIEAIKTVEGNVKKTQPQALGSGIIEEGHRAQIADVMRLAVLQGTAKNAAVSGIDVGGKTGTAETQYGYDDGWFCGFAKTDSASVAVVVLLENATSSDASRVASSVIAGSLGEMGGLSD